MGRRRSCVRNAAAACKDRSLSIVLAAASSVLVTALTLAAIAWPRQRRSTVAQATQPVQHSSGDHAAQGNQSVRHTEDHAARGNQSVRHTEDYVVRLSAARWYGSTRLSLAAALDDKWSEHNQNQVKDSEQQLLLSTGSSVLAFCNASLVERPSWSDAFITCEVNNFGSSPVGFWGYLYNGNVTLGGNHGLLLSSTQYTIMEQETAMPCQQGFGGIFGIAFGRPNLAYTDVGAVLPWSDGGERTCPSEHPVGRFESPLLQSPSSFNDGTRLIGIYWSGDDGASAGALYVDGAATSADHYINGTSAGKAILGELGSYDIVVEEIVALGEAWTGFSCNPQISPCVLDTASPEVVLPKELYLRALIAAREGLPLGSLRLSLAGRSATEPVSLELDLAVLLRNRWVRPGPQVVLGLPIWASYYTVFNISDRTVEFLAPRVGDQLPSGAREHTAPHSSASSMHTGGGSVALVATEWAKGVRLAIRSTLVGTSQAQNLVLDTGSSTLAFCDTGLAEHVSARRTPYLSCNRYNPGGVPTGYWGYFYDGAVQLDGGLLLNNSAYSIMQQQAQMPCTHGFGGIFGIAFPQLSLAFPVDEAPALQLEGFGTCPEDARGTVMDPLLRTLGAEGGIELLGIYWSGRLGRGEGRLYLDKAALSAPQYEIGAVGKAALGERGFYEVAVEQISAAGQHWTELQCQRTSKPCILDTGTPLLMVPKVVAASVEAAAQQGFPLGNISFKLQGSQGQPSVILEFDLTWLMEQGWLQGGDQLILGLPIWARYYTVFDIKGHSAEFFRHGSEISTMPGAAHRRLEERKMTTPGAAEESPASSFAFV